MEIALVQVKRSVIDRPVIAARSGNIDRAGAIIRIEGDFVGRPFHGRGNRNDAGCLTGNFAGCAFESKA
jgi:hypothetical protein